MMTNSMTFKTAMIVLLLSSYGCAEEARTSSEHETQVFELIGLHRGHSTDSLVNDVLAGVNCLAAMDANKKLLLVEGF